MSLTTPRPGHLNPLVSKDLTHNSKDKRLKKHLAENWNVILLTDTRETGRVTLSFLTAREIFGMRISSVHASSSRSLQIRDKGQGVWDCQHSEIEADVPSEACICRCQQAERGTQRGAAQASSCAGGMQAHEEEGWEDHLWARSSSGRIFFFSTYH